MVKPMETEMGHVKPKGANNKRGGTISLTSTSGPIVLEVMLLQDGFQCVEYKMDCIEDAETMIKDWMAGKMIYAGRRFTAEDKARKDRFAEIHKKHVNGTSDLTKMPSQLSSKVTPPPTGFTQS